MNALFTVLPEISFMNHRPASFIFAAVLFTPAVIAFSTAAAAELEEIVTTAERRSSNVQDAPLAVSTFTTDEIDRRQITGTLDLIQNVPNMSGSHNVSLGGSNSYFLRGIGNAESIATFDVPIGTYIDEIYISRQNQNQVRLIDVEKLEVLRGPQGTLFGRNTTGGAIVVVSEKPSDEFSTTLEGGAGSYKRRYLKADVNVPITDKFYAKFGAFGIDEDGWMDSVNTDDKYNGEEGWGLRGATRWVPTDAVTWDLSLQYSDTEVQAIGTAASTGSGTANPKPITGDFTKAQTALGDCTGPESDAAGLTTPACSFNKMEALLVASNVAWDTGPVTINFITGWYDLEQNYQADFFDQSTVPFGGALGNTFIIANNGQHEQFSQEIKLTGDFADGAVNYVGGLFYMDEDNTTTFTDWVNFGALVPFNVRTPLENTTQSYAVYGQFDWDLTAKLGVLAGGRWTQEDKDFSIDAILSGVPVTDAEVAAEGIPLDQSVDKFTYNLGLDYKFTDDIMAYGTVTTSFKSGGWNARGSTAAELKDFGPEDVISYEAGLRSEWFNNRLRTNLTVFLAQYDDVQIATTTLDDGGGTGGGLFLTTNAGDTEIRGLELEVASAVTDDLRIYGNLGLMDGKYTRLTESGEAEGIGPDPARTPDATANIGADYILPMTVLSGNFFLGGQVAWVDDYYMGNSNQIETLIEAHTLVNAQVGWRNDNWEAIVECKNCADEEWFGTNLFDVLYTADPVRWGIRLKYSYQ
jgi:iron complex outermembrane receptor protein